jgi:ABC-type glycerol-3-phosphate transport system permease component
MENMNFSFSCTLPAHPKKRKPLKAQSKLEIKRNGGTWALFFLVFLIFVLYAFSIFYPIIWGFISSFQSQQAYYYNISNPPSSFWEALQFRGGWSSTNYSEAITKLSSSSGVTFMQMFWNSTWFSIGSIVINLFFVSLTAYVIAKYRFRGRKIVYMLAIITMVVPIYGSLPASLRLYRQLHMYDSPLILLSAIGGFGTNFVLLVSYYRNISWTYAEASMMDGAGHWRTYFRVMMPLARPMLVSMFLLGFIGKWNDYMSCLLYLPTRYVTLAGGIYQYQTKVAQGGNYPVLFAGIFLSLIPVVVLFALLSKTMMKNMTFGGIKG